VVGKLEANSALELLVLVREREIEGEWKTERKGRREKREEQVFLRVTFTA
jgi:hypothetical protein